MDLLNLYSELIRDEISCTSLRQGDWIKVNVVPGTFLSGTVKSGTYEVNHVSLCVNASCEETCATNRICVYIKVPYIYYETQYRGTCNSRIYDKDGRKFKEDFDYYKEHPNYEE